MWTNLEKRGTYIQADQAQNNVKKLQIVSVMQHMLISQDNASAVEDNKDSIQTTLESDLSVKLHIFV